MLLLNRLNSINAQINVYLEEIALLQGKVTQLQAHAQEVQGAEQAAESALAQIDTAMQMLSVICPDEIATFKAAIDARFNQPLPQLTPATDPDTAQDSPTPSLHPSDDDDEVIETTAVVVEDGESQLPAVDAVNAIADSDGVSAVAAPQPSGGNGNGNGNGHHLLSYDQLRIIDRPTLIKLANTHNIPNYKTRKRDELASLLDGMVATDELERAQNGRH